MASKKKKEEKTIDAPLDFKMLEAIVKRYGGEVFDFNVRIPDQIKHLASNTLQNFFKLPLSVQLTVLRAYDVRGKFNAKKGKKGGFIFQMAKGGTQQIKEYKPEIYKNERNTPLRIRARTIMHLASKELLEKRKEKVRELYITYPYYLLKDEPVKLRMKNFYFQRYVKEGNLIKVYRLRESLEDLEPDPEQDILYKEKEYAPKKTVLFEYEGRDEEYYYAVNSRNNEISKVLVFVWKDEMNEVVNQ